MADRSSAVSAALKAPRTSQGRVASMGDGLRTVRVVTTDEALLASARAAAGGLEGWELDPTASVEELLARPPAVGDVILLDGWMRGGSVYETCRRLTPARPR